MKLRLDDNQHEQAGVIAAEDDGAVEAPETLGASKTGLGLGLKLGLVKSTAVDDGEATSRGSRRRG